MSVTQPFTYLIASADRTPEAVAVSTPDVDVTYSELLDTSRRFARLMREAGVSRGDVVGVIAMGLVAMRPRLPIIALNSRVRRGLKDLDARLKRLGS